MSIKKNNSFFDSTNNAIIGIISSFKNERNLRIHFLSAILVLLLALRLQATKIELALLLLSITFVFLAEMINTTIEIIIDAFVDRLHPSAGLAKDVAAGGVLITAIGAVVVGYLVFYEHFRRFMPLMYNNVKVIPLHVTIVTLLLVMLMTIILKTLSPQGTPLRGGMPSGHTALAFATATVILWFTKDTLVVSAAFLLAIMVAHSRVETKIHGWWEVLSGALLGFLLTILLFKVFLV